MACGAIGTRHGPSGRVGVGRQVGRFRRMVVPFGWVFRGSRTLFRTRGTNRAFEYAARTRGRFSDGHDWVTIVRSAPRPAVPGGFGQSWSGGTRAARPLMAAVKHSIGGVTRPAPTCPVPAT